MKNIIIAIDGFSSCGKSTIAKALAAKLAINYIDSGAMYRAVTWYFLQNQINLDNVEQVLAALNKINIKFVFNDYRNASDTFLNGENIEEAIRSMEVSAMVSQVSALKEVRQAMVALQQQAAVNASIVMDGRDIGTHVFPNADLKIFMTAAPEIRAQRRFLELQAKGQQTNLKEIADNLAHRDYLDSTRKESPLVQASDAVILDNSFMNQEQQLELVLSWVKALQTT